MTTAWFGWNLSDTRLTTRGLRLAVEAPLLLDSPEEWLPPDPVEIPQPPRLRTYISPPRNQPGALFNTWTEGGAQPGARVLGLRPVETTPVLGLANLSEYSDDTREVTGVYGGPGQWLLCMTDSLSSRGLNGKYLVGDDALDMGEALQLDFSMFVPEDPAAFRWELRWAGTLALRMGYDGQAGLYEESEGSDRLRAVAQLFGPPLWQRHLRLNVLPLRNRQVWVGSNDGMVLAWTNPTPIVQVTPDLRAPWGGGAPALYVTGANLYSVWSGVRYADGLSDSIVLARGQLLDLGEERVDLSLDYEADTQPGTGIVAWLEDSTGGLTNSGRYVRPCLSLASDPEGKFSPFVYNLAVVSPAVCETVDMASVDLSDWWESAVAQDSLEDLNAQVEVLLRPDAPAESLSPQLRRLAGFDLDGTPLLRAYLTPEIAAESIHDRMRLKGRGRMQRLEHSLFDGSETFAGLEHAAAMEQLLQGAGFGPQDYVIEVDSTETPKRLPERDGSDHDPTVPDVGTTRREFALWLCRVVSGWVLRELDDGRLSYAPLSTTNRGEWLESGGEAVPANRRILADSWQEDRDPERFYNEIWVVGQSAAAEPVVGVWLNSASQHDAEAADYVGERRLLIYLDPSLTDEDMVEQALALLQAEIGRGKRRARFRSLHDRTVLTGDLLSARGLTWRIVGRRRELGPPDVTIFTTYEVEEYVATA